MILFGSLRVEEGRPGLLDLILILILILILFISLHEDDCTVVPLKLHSSQSWTELCHQAWIIYYFICNSQLSYSFYFSNVLSSNPPPVESWTTSTTRTSNSPRRTSRTSSRAASKTTKSSWCTASKYCSTNLVVYMADENNH